MGHGTAFQIPHWWKIMERSRIGFHRIEWKTIRKSWLFPYQQSELWDFTNFRASLIGILSGKLEPEMAEITDLSRLTSWILIILNLWWIFTGEMSESGGFPFDCARVKCSPAPRQLATFRHMRSQIFHRLYRRSLLKSCLHFLATLIFWE
jgi:hypothetical protein